MLATYAALSTGQTPASEPTNYLLDSNGSRSFVLVVENSIRVTVKKKKLELCHDTVDDEESVLSKGQTL